MPRKKQVTSSNNGKSNEEEAVTTTVIPQAEEQAWSTPVSDLPQEPWEQYPLDLGNQVSNINQSIPDDGSANWTAASSEEPANIKFQSDQEGTWLASPEPADIISQEAMEEAVQDDWAAGASLAENMLLSIETHSGTFDKDRFKLMLFGETGTQKTRFASTFPGVIFADVDHGMSSVSIQVQKQFVPDDDSGFKVLSALYDYLARGGHDFDAVVLDTLNEMQRVIMRATIEEFTHIRRSYGNLPGQSDYGKMLYEFMELTRAFISLPMKVVLLCQTSSKFNEGEVIGPQLIGKNTARELERKMDIIGYIYKENDENGTHPVITFDAVNYMTKDRSNKLPVALVNPSYSKMASYWK